MVTGFVRNVRALLAAVGVLSCAAVILVLLQMTARLDAQANAAASDRHAALLAEEVEALTLAVEDYAARSRGDAPARGGLGPADRDQLRSVVTRSEIFDWVFLTDRSGRVLHSFGPQPASGDAQQWVDASAQGFKARLWQTDPRARRTVSAIAPWRDGYAIMAAARVAGADGDTQTALIGVKELDADKLASFTARAYARALRVQQAPPAAGAQGIPLKGVSGTVGWMLWEPLRPGRTVFWDMVPWIGGVCLAIACVLVTAGRTVGQMGHRLQEALKRAATDPLTGLTNRAGLQARLAEPVFKAALHAGRVSVIVIDLNDFKQLNDTQGHQAGDAALKTIAARLRASVRGADIVARLGGDEFVCAVLEAAPKAGEGRGQAGSAKRAAPIGRRSAAQTVANRICTACAAPIDWAGHTIPLRLSIGVAQAAPGLGWDTLVARADLAMYQAKTNGAAHPVIYDAHPANAPAMSTPPRARQETTGPRGPGSRSAA